MPDKTIHSPNPPRRALTLDVDKYQRMLDAPDMDDAKRQELFEALWLLVVSFVDLGFDVQSAENTCGKHSQKPVPRPQSCALMIDSYHSETSAVFASAANAPATKQEAS